MLTDGFTSVLVSVVEVVVSVVVRSSSSSSALTAHDSDLACRLANSRAPLPFMFRKSSARLKHTCTQTCRLLQDRRRALVSASATPDPQT